MAIFEDIDLFEPAIEEEEISPVHRMTDFWAHVDTGHPWESLPEDEMAEILATPISSERDNRNSFERTVLKSLEDDFNDFIRLDRTHFVCDGQKQGCGFTSGTITLNPEDKTATFVLRTGIKIPDEKRMEISKYLRKKNNEWIVSGMKVDENGEIVFAPEPTLIEEGGVLNEDIRRATSTIHAEVGNLIAIICGKPAYEVAQEDSKSLHGLRGLGGGGLMDLLSALDD